jgi:hypothetical protein
MIYKHTSARTTQRKNVYFRKRKLKWQLQIKRDHATILRLFPAALALTNVANHSVGTDCGTLFIILARSAWFNVHLKFRLSCCTRSAIDGVTHQLAEKFQFQIPSLINSLA